MKLLNKKNFEAIETFWKFLIYNKVDYNMLISENPNCKNEEGFGESGCVYQLFKMFNNEYEFGLKKKGINDLIAKVYFMILNNIEILLFLYLNNILNSQTFQ